MKAKAEQRRQEALARQAAAEFALPVDVGPGPALLQEVQRTAGLVAWLEVKVAEVAGRSPDSLIYGKTSEKLTYGGEEGGSTSVIEESAALNMWLTWWQQERDRLIKVCAAALRAGVEERRVQIAEAQAQSIVAMLQGLFADLSLSPEQEALLPTIVPRHLRAISPDDDAS